MQSAARLRYTGAIQGLIPLLLMPVVSGAVRIFAGVAGISSRAVLWWVGARLYNETESQLATAAIRTADTARADTATFCKSKKLLWMKSMLS